MYRIKTLNQISPAGLSVLDHSRFTVEDGGGDEDGILVRSADMHDYAFPPTLRAIARAGAGTNNIPIDRCSEAGIVVFNTPGANANAVKELVVCGLLLSSRRIVSGVEWVKEQAASGIEVADVVEKGKGQFVGPEIAGKSLGVVGLGAIGVQVANIATKLGMTVFGYDPYLSVDGALSLSRLVHRAMDLDTIFQNCDYITLHVPLTDQTKGLINRETIRTMRDGVRILNLARGPLVQEEDILAALDEGKVGAYVTDFPNSRLAAHPGVIAIPHLGASSPESEENCAVMAARQLGEYLENGNIKNSVNLPDLEQAWSGIARVCILHRNIPAMLAKITSILSQEGVNVENLTNKSKKDYAYTVVDINTEVGDHVLEEIRAVEGVLRVRFIRH